MTTVSTGRIDKIIRDYKTVQKSTVHIGIVKPEIKSRKGRSVQLATVYRTQEQGSSKSNVPARPTLTPGVREAKYGPRVNNLVGNIGAGNGPMLGLNKIGEVADLRVKAYIQGIKTPPLQARTIANRVNAGTTNPLVDTGQLKKAINHKIERR